MFLFWFKNEKKNYFGYKKNCFYFDNKTQKLFFN